jgi:hypothetical protein
MKTCIVLSIIAAMLLSGCASEPVLSSRLVIKRSPHGEEWRILPGLHWEPMWVSHLGCIKGSLAFLHNDISDAWVFGGTGHAFIMNIHKEVCPSGPTAFNSEMILRLGRNIGFDSETVFATRTMKQFKSVQKQAWKITRTSIDQGYPCVGWELEIPEYYVVYGYDELGYYYSGPLCDEGKGPRKWNTLGDTEIGVLNMTVIKPVEPASDRKTVREALEFAYTFATTRRWINERYYSGLEAYDHWITALENKTADGAGNSYNAAVWNECRGQAVDFLKEARQRLAGVCDAEFDEAIASYETVSRNLQEVALLFPFLNTTEAEKLSHVKSDRRIAEAVQNLKRAREAEKNGLRSLLKIITALQPLPEA